MNKLKKWTPERLREIKAYRDTGKTWAEVNQKFGNGAAAGYYAYRGDIGEGTPKKTVTPKLKAKHRFVDMPAEAPTTAPASVTIIKCNVDQLANVLRGLQ